MTQNSNNPLRQFFRRPAIFLKLPSNGVFWPADSLDMTVNGEFPVYPMTAIDEITYRTPDALFNGEAVVSVIHSCIPSIKNAWDAPMTDFDAILIAIRIASYGHELDLTTSCPKCNHTADYTVDLRTVLDQQQSPDFNKTVSHGDLEIFFKPINYRSQHDSNSLQFEEQRTIQMIPGSDLPDAEKIQRLNEALRRITELTVDTLKHSIGGIRTPQALVTEPEFIQEFLNNCDRTLFNSIRDTVIALRQSSEIKPMHIKCDNCGNEYDQPFTLDMANFFEPAS